MRSPLTPFQRRALTLGGLATALVVASALRLFLLPDLIVQGGDQARDALVVQRMLATGQPVLEGSITSAGAFHRGPAYYYLLALAYALSLGHPIGGALLSVTFDLAAMVMAFVLVSAVAGPLAGVGSASLWAVSPIMVEFARFQWNPQLMPFFALLAVYAALRIARGDGRWLVVLVPAWLLAWQMHEPSLLLLPMLGLVLIWKRGTWTSRENVVGAAALGLATTLPFFVGQLSNGFRDVIGMARYALDGLLGAGPPAVLASLSDRIVAALQGMRHGLPGPEAVHLSIVGLALIGVGWAAWRLRDGLRAEPVIVLLFAATPLLFAFWRAPFHGHYLLILYPLPLILAAVGGAAVIRLRPPVLAPLAGSALAVVVAASALGSLSARAGEDSSPRRWNNRLSVVSQVVRDAAGRPFAWRLETDIEGRDGWRAPYEYAFAYAGAPDLGRADVRTYVIWDPADFGTGPSEGGALVDGIRWAAFPAPTVGGELLSGEWRLGSSGAIVDAGGEISLAVDWPWQRQDALHTLTLEPEARYMVSFEHRTEGGGPFWAARPLVYQQISARDGSLVATSPNGSGYRAVPHSAWTRGSFIFRVPPEGVGGRLVLRARGSGVVYFRGVHVREVVRDEAPW